MKESDLTPSEKEELDTWLQEQDRAKVEQRMARIAVSNIKERYETGDSLIDPEDLEELDDDGSEAFEPTTDPNLEKLSELSEKTSKVQEAMYKISLISRRQAVRTKRNLDRDNLKWRLALKKEQQDTLENNPKSLSDRGKTTDLMRLKITKSEQKLEELKNLTPESWGAINGLELRKNIQEIKQGKLVKTPYVERNIKRLKNNIERGQPSFIHGHLGSGKTELAITAAKESVLEAKSMEIAKYEYDQWLKDAKEKSVNPSGDQRREYLATAYQRTLNYMTSQYNKGDSDLVEKVSPLIISGSKDLTSQDLYSEKTLKLTKFNGKAILEHKADLEQQIQQWQEDNAEMLNAMTLEQRQKAEAEAANQILEIYKLKNQAFGTEVETVKKEIYRGVLEGRPVIIDEVNAIPSAVLISMNDILQRRPGQTCFIPGTGTVKIQPGFSIIMTGNLSSSNVSYEGTNDLNPAFQSRLDTFEYDYLPQSCEDRDYKDQTDPSRNELFRAIITQLLDDKGHLQLPEMDKSLTQLFRLAQLARETQNIFSEKWAESHINTDISGDEAEPRLERSVLSIRNIRNVLLEWNKGGDKDLDMALWDGFISQIINPDDQNLILSLAKKFNFFNSEDGWDVETKPVGLNSLTSLREIRTFEYEHQLQPLETMPMVQVLEYIFGPPPARTEYPDISQLELDDFVNEGEEISPEEYIELVEQQSQLTNVRQALEALAEKAGCLLTPKE